MQQLPSSSLCQKCRISMVFSSQEAVEASMVNTYFIDNLEGHQAGSLVPQLNMLNGDK